MPSSPAPHRALEGPASRAVCAPGGSDPQQGPTGATEPARSNVQQTLLPSPGGLRAHGALPSPQGGAHCTRGPRSRAADSGLLGAVCSCPCHGFLTSCTTPNREAGEEVHCRALALGGKAGLGSGKCSRGHTLGLPSGAPLFHHRCWGLIPNSLGSVRKPGWNPDGGGKPRAPLARIQQEMPQGPHWVPRKGLVCGRQSPEHQEGREEVILPRSPRPHTPSWSLSLCCGVSTFGENKA